MSEALNGSDSNPASSEPAQAIGSDTALMSFVGGLGGLALATSGNFTFDKSVSLPGNFGVITPSGTQITVAVPLTVTGLNTLALDSGGTTVINAPITVAGAGNVTLDYDAASPQNLTFAQGADINYGATNNGGTLAVNGQPYTLLYTASDVRGMSLTGHSALATPLDAGGTTYSDALIAPGTGSTQFTGTFEGLGNTISNLTIDTAGYGGLFGDIGSGGVVRDIGVGRRRRHGQRLFQFRRRIGRVQPGHDQQRLCNRDGDAPGRRVCRRSGWSQRQPGHDQQRPMRPLR